MRRRSSVETTPPATRWRSANASRRDRERCADLLGRLPHLPTHRGDDALPPWLEFHLQKFLGHSDPGFTLRTYVHLMPEDLPETSFLDELTAQAAGGTNVGTQPDETR